MKMQSYGHTLALFTSYRMMEITYQELAGRINDFSLFSMGKGGWRPSGSSAGADGIKMRVGIGILLEQGGLSLSVLSA